MHPQSIGPTRYSYPPADDTTQVFASIRKLQRELRQSRSLWQKTKDNCPLFFVAGLALLSDIVRQVRLPH